jgi:hypothetical protein
MEKWQDIRSQDDRRLLAEEYRKQEDIRAANDIQGLREHQIRLEREGRFPEAEEVQRKISTCDHAKFLAAGDELAKLTDRATDLVVPALDRLIASYDIELNDFALRRETDLSNYGQPLYKETPNRGGPQFTNGRTQETYCRYWALWDDAICTQLHSCREVTRNLRQKFDGYSTYSTREIRAMYSIATLQHLFTAEDCNFSWL